MTNFDHPIFVESIRIIQAKLGSTGLEPLQKQVLERLIHTSGDFSIQSSLRFGPLSCEAGVQALKAGAPILTDTAMAAAAISPMAARTFHSKVFNALDWAPVEITKGTTKTAIGMKLAWAELSNEFAAPAPIVVIGSSPTALELLLKIVSKGAHVPSLIVGMPVGFVGVISSKEKLRNSVNPYIMVDGNRGGAALAAATVNALLRASFLDKKAIC